MRPVYLASLDKDRPCVILTRDAVFRVRSLVTVVAITTSVRGLSSEVPVGTEIGIDEASVINCDDIHTISTKQLIREIGSLHDNRETELASAIHYAFALSR